MKKNLLILFVMALSLFKLDAYSQCTPTGNQIFNTAFGEPGMVARYSGYMCAAHDTLVADNMGGGQNDFRFNDGDGYGIRLVSGSVITISIFNSLDTISITMNDTSCAGNVISSAYAPPNVNNTLTFTAPYTGMFRIVFNKNGFCGGSSVQPLGAVIVALTNGGSITCPAAPMNDSICGAMAITLGTVYTGDNSYANITDAFDTLQVVPAGYNCSPPNNTMWYSYTPTVTTFYDFTLSSPSCGLFGRSGMILLKGANCSDSVLSATCLNSQAAAGTSITSKVMLTAGVTVYFMIDGRASSSGVFNVTINTSPPPPANDTICSAVTMLINNTYNGNNANALPTDPMDAFVMGTGYTNCSGSISGSMWYKFTPTTSGNYNINTASFANVGLSTSIAYFTGTNCNSTLTYVNCYRGPSPNNLTNNAVYTTFMTGGQTYYFMVEGVNNGNTSGTFSIGITQGAPSPANDTICGAITLVLNTVVIDDNTNALVNDPMNQAIVAAGYTNNTCGTPNNILWYKFTAPDTANFVIETTSPATGGLHAHVGVFAATRCDTNAFTPNPDRCYEGCNIGTTKDDTIKLNGGITYYIFVDGYQGTKGQYTIEILGTATGIYSMDVMENTITIAPNPTSNYFRIKFEQAITENTKVEVLDLLGRIVYTSTIKSGSNASDVDLSSLANGNYFVKISNEKTILYHQQIVKQ
ncbi:MAG: hypothetical protein RJA07_956 [Bacteroidota bacterium]|jgi:hypothetical protein